MAISITKPTVNGSNNTWGDTINTALDTIVDAVNGSAGEVAPDLSEGSWKIGGTAITATAAEINLLDGDTSATATTVEGTDSILLNDGGVMKQVAMSDIGTYVNSSTNNATITVTAGDALTGGGSFTVNQAGNATITVNHEDTSSQSSVNNSGNTFIQDITLDTYGHVTGITSATGGASTATGTMSLPQDTTVSVSTGIANGSYIYGSTSGAGGSGSTDGSGNFNAYSSTLASGWWLAVG